MNDIITFQKRLGAWMNECFGEAVAADASERNHRFLEEALELVQANGCSREEAHLLVDYVFDREIGSISQEVGGTMLTLAALCNAVKRDMFICGEVELARVNTPTMIAKIRAKQATKPASSPLPGRSPSEPGAAEK